jgi:hypothetical protein
MSRPNHLPAEQRRERSKIFGGLPQAILRRKKVLCHAAFRHDVSSASNRDCAAAIPADEVFSLGRYEDDCHEALRFISPH